MQNSRNLEKRAMAQKALNALLNRARQKDFVGGLISPLARLAGTAQKDLGYLQQARGIAGNLYSPTSKYKVNFNAPYSALKKSPSYTAGSRNVREGEKLREEFDFLKGLGAGTRKKKNPLSYRIGRGVGGVGMGGAIIGAPFTAATYLGGAAADPEYAASLARTQAYDQLQNRLQQFQQMPFMDRLSNVLNPEGFTSRVLNTNFSPNTSPEENQETMAQLESVLQNPDAAQTLNNPGILKYLSAFNPFSFGGAEAVVRDKTRGQMLSQILGGQKEASVDKSAGVWSKVIRPAFSAGRLHSKGLTTKMDAKRMGAKKDLQKGQKQLTQASKQMKSILKQNKGMFPSLAAQGAHAFGKSPFGTTAKALLPTSSAYFLGSTYGAGKDAVYDQAQRDARALVDLQLMNMFNTPGFMGGLNRFGAAVAPGMYSNLIQNQFQNLLYQ